MADQQRDLINFFYRSFSNDIGLLSERDLDGSIVSQAEPLIIYDLTGAKLFADYEIVDPQGVKVGVVRSSARQKDLPLIDSILIGNQWFDASTALEKAKAAAVAKNIGAIVAAKLVCYGYPRMGVLVTCRSAVGDHSIVFDAAAGVIVKQWDGKFDPVPEAGGVPISAQPEGLPFYSMLSEMPEAGVGPLGASARQWDDIQSAFTDAKSRGLALHMLNAPAPAVQPGIRFAVRGSLLPATLYSQTTQVFCAVATAEMMLSFVGIPKTQDEIAAAMGTGATGTTNPDFITGFTGLTSHKFTAQFSNSPSFTDFVQIVEQTLPAKSGIPGHARLLRGWREYLFLDSSGSVLDKEQFLIINDPYPLGSGQLALENIAKPIDSFYTNVISMQRAPI